MKVDSPFIELFLLCVDRGWIRGRKNSFGSEVLDEMADAFRKILKGEVDMNDALRIIKRNKRRLHRVMPAVHELRKQGMPWKEVARHKRVNYADYKTLSKHYRKNFKTLYEVTDRFAESRKSRVGVQIL